MVEALKHVELNCAALYNAFADVKTFQEEYRMETYAMQIRHCTVLYKATSHIRRNKSGKRCFGTRCTLPSLRDLGSHGALVSLSKTVFFNVISKYAHLS